jgi:hypothetical protein
MTDKEGNVYSTVINDKAHPGKFIEGKLSGRVKV